MIETTFEQKLLIVLVVWVALAPRVASRLHCAMLRACGRLARRRGLWIFGCGAAAGVVSALAASWILWPEPSIHDEFSHLLMAETFARGEVARPTHPLWEHFETFHVLHEPTYASKYPPGPALPLALGIALFGEPAVGLWLQSAALCAAIAWMLFGWLPPRWAVLGSLVCLLQFGTNGTWVRTYFGGAFAATGGALVFGALPRVLCRPRVPHALILGLGLAMLANSRPYEGLLASLPVAALLLARRPDARALLPIAGVLALTVAAMAAYNTRVTGEATRLPYSAYDEAYAVYPPFLWSAAHPVPEYRHRELRRFNTGFQRGDHGAVEGVPSFLAHAGRRLWKLGRDFVGVPLLFALLAAALRARGRGVRPAAATCLLVAAGLLATTYLEGRYAAPATAAVLLLCAAGWRALPRLPRLGRRRGHAASVALAVAVLVLAADRTLTRTPAAPQAFGYVRAEHVARLLAEPGDDLVLVSYGRGHSVHHEWVYNAADIDAAPIVWARDMGAEANRRLLDHFADRKPWRLTMGGPGTSSVELAPVD